MASVRVERATRSFAVLILFTSLAPEAWQNLVSLWGVTVIGVGLGIATTVILTVTKSWPRFNRFPLAIIVFLGFALLSLAWSAWPVATLIGLLRTAVAVLCAIFLAMRLDWATLSRALGRTIHWILWLSILFELYVSLIVKHPITPFWTDFGDDPPLLSLWSRNLLFSGGPIQGIVGNSIVLCMAAAIGVIVFAIQIKDRTRKRAPIAGLALAVLTLGLTRSATVIIGLGVVAVVLAIALLVRRTSVARRWIVTTAGLVVLGGGAALALALQSTVLGFFGKSDDLTGRLEIWQKVGALADQRPVVGHGWVGAWVPWIDPFDHLVVRHGFLQLQAHSAWLDLKLQLGYVGVILFAVVLLGVLVRAWWLAVDRRMIGAHRSLPYSALQLLPLLIVTLLAVQSVVESRLLIEGGLVLLVAFAVKLKGRHLDTELAEARAPAEVVGVR